MTWLREIETQWVKLQLFCFFFLLLEGYECRKIVLRYINPAKNEKKNPLSYPSFISRTLH